MVIPSVMDKPMVAAFLVGLAALLAVLALRVPPPVAAKKAMADAKERRKKATTAAQEILTGAARLSKSAAKAEAACELLELEVKSAKDSLTLAKRELDRVKDQESKKVLTAERTAQAKIAVGESAILLHPPLPLVGVLIGMKRGCHQNDSLAVG